MNEILSFVILALAVPAGYILRHYTKEELKSGRKYFLVIWITCLALAFIFLFMPLEDAIRKTTIFSLLFISVVSYISWK
ncbi:hypothetical protein J4466_05370 [Candidatus Pacearchaeota archaeon]|nr:hypothetical protein [Candidatus Pacearchaeota archaeon]